MLILYRVSITDNRLNLTTIELIKKIKICNCNRVDKQAKCSVDRVVETFDSGVDFQACKCSNAYAGKYCERLKDHCSTRPCASLINLRTKAPLKCFNLAPALQTSLNKSYACCSYDIYTNGTCRSDPTPIGFRSPLNNLFKSSLFPSLNSYFDDQDFTLIFQVILPIIGLIFILSLLSIFVFLIIEK